MDDNKHEPFVQSTITAGALDRAEMVALALLVPRVALGWASLQLGWRTIHLTSLPPLTASWLLALGLTLSGIALILGLLAGPSAFVSGALSASAWEQGNAAMASVMFALAVLLVVAWRSAGQIGLDRWLLPSLGLADYRGALVTRGRLRAEKDRDKDWVNDGPDCGQDEMGRGEIAR
jgi:hypothetical protein